MEFFLFSVMLLVPEDYVEKGLSSQAFIFPAPPRIFILQTRSTKNDIGETWLKTVRVRLAQVASRPLLDTEPAE